MGNVCQGNVRLVTIRTKSGQVVARAVLRILLRARQTITLAGMHDNEEALQSMGSLLARALAFRQDAKRMPLAAVLKYLPKPARTTTKSESGITGENDQSLEVENTEDEHYLCGPLAQNEDLIIWMENPYVNEAIIDENTAFNTLRSQAFLLAKLMNVPLLSIDDVEVIMCTNEKLNLHTKNKTNTYPC